MLSLISREMLIKVKMKLSLILVRKAGIKKTKENKCWQGWRERDALHSATLFIGNVSTFTSKSNMEVPQNIKSKPGTRAHVCNPSYSGGRDQEDLSLKSAPGKKFPRLYLEKASKCEALSSNPSAAKKEKKRKA
jgi:hypothetical protein